MNKRRDLIDAALLLIDARTAIAKASLLTGKYKDLFVVTSDMKKCANDAKSLIDMVDHVIGKVDCQAP